jgi:hypothetical protein
MLSTITQPVVFMDIVDATHAKQIQDDIIAFGIQLARRGDKYLMEEYYKAFGVNKQQLLSHPDYPKYTTSL